MTRAKTPKPIPFGQWLKDCRERADVTQRELARALKYDSAQFISNIERGVALPPTEAVPIIAKILGIPRQRVLEQVYQEKNRQLMDWYEQRKKEMA